MKVPFYILGLLIRYGPEHGYRLKQIMEAQIADFAHIKLPTLYYHLENLAKKGYIDAVSVKDGNRPEKTVYSITKSGREYFSLLCHKLLKEVLVMELPLDGLLFFSECVPVDNIVQELGKRKITLENQLKLLETHRAVSMPQIAAEGKAYARLIFEHHQLHMEAELAWIKNALHELG